MSQALRKLTGTVARSQCMLIFINQIRMKIGVMFGNPETTTGGNALKFYASVRLDIRRIGAIKETAAGGKEPSVVGNRTRVKVVKNKLAPPFREVEFDILYGQGISRMGDIIDLGVEAGIVEKSGAWFSFQGERIGQGRENARAFLEQNPATATRIEALILDKHGIRRGGPKDQVNGAAAGGSAPAAGGGRAPQSGGASQASASAPAQPVAKSDAKERSAPTAAPKAPQKTN
jgi:recombination protein RecA